MRVIEEIVAADVIGQAPAAVVVTDTDLRVAVWNSAAEQLFGIAADAASGRSIARPGHPRAAGRPGAPDRRAGRRRPSMAGRVRHPAGRRLADPRARRHRAPGRFRRAGGRRRRPSRSKRSGRRRPSASGGSSSSSRRARSWRHRSSLTPGLQSVARMAAAWLADLVVIDVLDARRPARAGRDRAHPSRTRPRSPRSCAPIHRIPQAPFMQRRARRRPGRGGRGPRPSRCCDERLRGPEHIEIVKAARHALGDVRAAGRAGSGARHDAARRQPRAAAVRPPRAGCRARTSPGGWRSRSTAPDCCRTPVSRPGSHGASSASPTPRSPTSSSTICCPRCSTASTPSSEPTLRPCSSPTSPGRRSRCGPRSASSRPGGDLRVQFGTGRRRPDRRVDGADGVRRPGAVGLRERLAPGGRRAQHARRAASDRPPRPRRGAGRLGRATDVPTRRDRAHQARGGPDRAGGRPRPPLRGGDARPRPAHPARRVERGAGRVARLPLGARQAWPSCSCRGSPTGASSRSPASAGRDSPRTPTRR